MAGFLLNNGAEVDFPMPDGSTSLMLACTKGCEEMVKLILDNHPDTVVKNDNGYDAIECAAMTQHEKCADLITDYQVSHGIKSARGSGVPKLTVTGVSNSSLTIDDTDDLLLGATASEVKIDSDSLKKDARDMEDDDNDSNSWQSDTETAQPVKKTINSSKLKTFLGQAQDGLQKDEIIAQKPPLQSVNLKERPRPENQEVTPRSDVLNESMNSSGKKDGDSSIVQPPPGFDRQESDWDSTIADDTPQKESGNPNKPSAGTAKQQDSDWDSSIADDIPQLPELSVDDILEDGIQSQPTAVTLTDPGKNKSVIKSDWESSVMGDTARNGVSAKKQTEEESDWDISTVANTPRAPPNRNDTESDWDSSIGQGEPSVVKPEANIVITKPEESDWDSASSLAITPRTPRGVTGSVDTPRMNEIEEEAEEARGKSGVKGVGLNKQESDWDSSSMASEENQEEEENVSEIDEKESQIEQIVPKQSKTVETPEIEINPNSLSNIKETSITQPPPRDKKPVAQRASKPPTDNMEEEELEEEDEETDTTMSESVPALPNDEVNDHHEVEVYDEPKRSSVDSLGQRLEPTGEENLQREDVVLVDNGSSSDSDFGTGKITIKRMESIGSTIVSSFHQESVSKPVAGIPNDSDSESDSNFEVVKESPHETENLVIVKTSDTAQLSTSGFASKSVPQNEGKRAPIRSSNSVGYDSDSSLTDFDSNPFGREANELTTPLGSYIHGVLGGPNHPDIVNTNIMEQVHADAHQANDQGHGSGGRDALDYSSTDQEDSRESNRRGSKALTKDNTHQSFHSSKIHEDNSNNMISRLQAQLKETQRQFEMEKKNYFSLELSKKQLEVINEELKRQLEENKVAYRELQFSKVETEEKFNEKNYAFTEDEDKRRNLEILLTKTKQQLQKKEDELFNEQQSRQRADLDLRNVQMELKSLEINKKRLITEREDLLKALEYERSVRKKDDAKLAEDQLVIETLTQKLNSNAGKYQYESNLEQNATFQQEAIELANSKQELEQLRTRFRADRNHWLEENQMLQTHIDQLEAESKLNEEALAQASLHYTVQLNQLKSEYYIMQNNFESERSARIDMEHEITELRAQVEDLQTQLKKAHESLNDPKNKMPNIDWAEWNQKLQNKEREMIKLRDTNRSLSENLTETENRISAISTELENSSHTLEEKLNQIQALRDSLERHITDNSDLKEKNRSMEDELEKFTTKNECLSERMTDLLDNNTVIFHHLDTLLQGAVDREKLNQADIERISDIMDIITRQKSIEKSTRNSEASLNLMMSTSFLQSQTVVELEQTQKRCDQLQEKLKEIQSQHSTSIRKLSELETDLQTANLSKNNYQSECLKLKDQLDSNNRYRGRSSADGRTASHEDHLSGTLHSPPDTMYERSYAKLSGAVPQEAWMKTSGMPERDEFIKTFQSVITDNSLSNSPKYRTLERQFANTELALKRQKTHNDKLCHQVECLQRQLEEEDVRRAEMGATLETHKQTLDTDAKSIKQLNRKIAQIEREKLQLSRKLELEKSSLKKSEDRRHNLEEKLEEEIQKYAELESEYKNIQSLHKAAQKKVKELTKARIDSQHIDNNIGSLQKHLETLRREIELSSLQADCNAEQQEQNAKYLATIRSMEKTLEDLADQKKKLQQEYDSFRKYVEGSMIERSEVSRIRSDLEEKTRSEISEQVNRVTNYLEEVDRQRQSLDKARDDTEERLRTDLDRTRRDMREELERLRRTCDELGQDKERLKSENRKLERLLNQESGQHRSIIPEKLNGTNPSDLFTFESKLGLNTSSPGQPYDTFGSRELDQHVQQLSSASLAKATGEHQIASSGYAHYVGGSFSAIPSLYKPGKLNGMSDRFGGSHTSVNSSGNKVTSEFLHQKLKAELDRSIAKHLEADKSHRTKGCYSDAKPLAANGDNATEFDFHGDTEDVDLSFITFLRKKYFIS